MTDKSMAKPGEIDDDLDTLIDKAVDTFFVEAPSEEELSFQQETYAAPKRQTQQSKGSRSAPEAPSLDEVVDSLFVSSFSTPSAASAITSGDPETDRAIDLAVDTLFVEEPETPAPETAQVKVEESIEEDAFEDHLSSKGMARDHQRKAALPSREASASPRPTSAGDDIAYDDAMAKEIERHLHTLFTDKKADAPAPTAKTAGEKAGMVAKAPAATSETRGPSPLRKLQEAILTLEWEISRRSVTVLANEIRKVRIQHQDNVTVDFAALAMRVVLEYVIKRMSRAHPESIRFLLEVTDYLDRSIVASEEDPLRAFHHILTRYERYKSVVRKAEGLADQSPAILNQLEIKDPAAFAAVVERYARTMMKAGESLARRLPRTNDPENLIRSFRFLVNRSVSRMLERTHKENVPTRSSKTKSGRSRA
jgi:hypothetical protein